MIVESLDLLSLRDTESSPIVAVIDDSPDLADETYEQLKEIGYRGEILSVPLAVA